MFELYLYLFCVPDSRQARCCCCWMSPWRANASSSSWSPASISLWPCAWLHSDYCCARGSSLLETSVDFTGEWRLPEFSNRAPWLLFTASLAQTVICSIKPLERIAQIFFDQNHGKNWVRNRHNSSAGRVVAKHFVLRARGEATALESMFMFRRIMSLQFKRTM